MGLRIGVVSMGHAFEGAMTTKPSGIGANLPLLTTKAWRKPELV